jgi:hypothetical protein
MIFATWWSALQKTLMLKVTKHKKLDFVNENITLLKNYTYQFAYFLITSYFLNKNYDN